ncbi:hypothetical protein ER639_10400 [Macrococcus sp. DPC7161]|nr:glycerol-3-phosphate responsive antiterminator [Macrococcus sp. DPC7161]RXK17386.1 hypothetical protein ER639_10400 [Macrococcus sp. DPC7161]
MFDNIISTTKKSKPDAIEVMPVLTSYLFKDIYKATKIPIISGGLVDRIEQVEDIKKVEAYLN